MQDLSSYLNSEFLSDLEEIAQIDRVVNDVLPLFNNFFRKKDGAWPYEVANGEYPKYPGDSEITYSSERIQQPGNYYSFSTSAMILFALSASLNLLKSSVLIPTFAQWSDSRSIVGDDDTAIKANQVREIGIRSLIRESDKLRKSGDSKLKKNCPTISNSRAYGPNDPFTLLWIIEVLEPSIGEVNIDDFYRMCIDAAKVLVKGVYKNKERLSHVLDTRNALEHVFPLLYVVQLDSWLKRLPDYESPNNSDLLQYLQNRLYLHVSHYLFSDSRYDVAELVFTMEAILCCDQHSVDEPFIDRWLEVIEQIQQVTPNLRPSRPFIANEAGMALLPISVQVASSLLRISEILSRPLC